MSHMCDHKGAVHEVSGWLLTTYFVRGSLKSQG